jgi:hypothetical protein
MRRLIDVNDVNLFMAGLFGNNFLSLSCNPVVLLIALGYVFLFVTGVG